MNKYIVCKKEDRFKLVDGKLKKFKYDVKIFRYRGQKTYDRLQKYKLLVEIEAKTKDRAIKIFNKQNA